jgi:F-type H+-transporting ATPase subunit a
VQALTRPRVLLPLVLVLILFIVGVVFFGGPLETPTLQVPPFAEVFSYPIRSTVIQQWIAMLVVLAIVFFATRNMALVPGRLQGLVEGVVEMLLGLCERAAGTVNGRRFFPVVATIFLFIFSANWLGFIPGTGTIGVVEPAEEVIHHAEEEHEDLNDVHMLVMRENGNIPVGLSYTLGGEEHSSYDVTAAEYVAYEEELHDQGLTAGHLVPFLRPANTDVNTPLAIAIWSFIFVEFWGISALGLGYFGKFFNFSRLLHGNIAFGLIDVFVGFIDLISELVRLVSFTFRLFGNVFAGEILILMASFFFPLILVNVVFFMELFFGAIQAFIFAVLTLIFGILAVTSHSHEEGHGAGAAEHEHAVVHAA